MTGAEVDELLRSAGTEIDERGQGRLQPTGACHPLQRVGQGPSAFVEPASAGLVPWLTGWNAGAPPGEVFHRRITQEGGPHVGPPSLSGSLFHHRAASVGKPALASGSLAGFATATQSKPRLQPPLPYGHVAVAVSLHAGETSLTVCDPLNGPAASFALSTRTPVSNSADPMAMRMRCPL